MKKVAPLVVLAISLANQSAFAASTGGAGALALAALVAEHSPHLTRHEKDVMARMFNGKLNFSFPANKKILVSADSVVCRASDVDIGAHSCGLSFGAKTRALSGRKAHELYATVAEAGVQPDGAAGSIFESLSHLACTIDPNEVKQRAGGGADCQFTPGAP